MEWIDLIRYFHVVGATVLFGTGMGIAFFMLMAHRCNSAAIIAHVSGIVVLADYLFTATAAVAQPVTGYLLARHYGWPLSQGWLFLSLLLYVMVGMFWIPVVFIQKRMHELAKTAAENAEPLPEKYHSLFRVWFTFGFPAFFAVLAIFWLMLFKPEIAFGI